MSRYYVTTAIPYVNASPHLGHALEFVQADILARDRRLAGDEVRFLSGTDDHALKNVLAAETAKVPVDRYISERADEFERLGRTLGLSTDDYIRTSTDIRHRPGVEKLWRATAAAGDLYTRDYEGLYCVGCEQFFKTAELTNGRCPEHGTEPDLITERNWFFRLSRYAKPLLRAIDSGRLRIEPDGKRHEVTSFIRAGLDDISVSRSATRARGWGIPVPDDPGQVVYVWYDALGNYITALGYGTEQDDYRKWWVEADERVHVIGKGILRFHAVYWPAFLLSAGEPLPTSVFVHDYLTIDGAKISKSSGNTVDPLGLVDTYGVDALRWWLSIEVPRQGDADFTAARLVERANQDLANGFGNLLNRVAALTEKHRPHGAPEPPRTDPLVDLAERTRAEVRQALGRFDIRAGAQSVEALIRRSNAYMQQKRPWEATDAASFDETIGSLYLAIRTITDLLQVFTPELAERARVRLGQRSSGIVQPRIELVSP